MPFEWCFVIISDQNENITITELGNYYVLKVFFKFIKLKKRWFYKQVYFLTLDLRSMIIRFFSIIRLLLDNLIKLEWILYNLKFLIKISRWVNIV